MRYEILLDDKELKGTVIFADGDSISADDNFVYIKRNTALVSMFHKDKIMFIRENEESNMPFSELRKRDEEELINDLEKMHKECNCNLFNYGAYLPTSVIKNRDYWIGNKK